MDLTTYIHRVQDELDRSAEIGGDDAIQLARKLTLPLESALRVALLDALADAAAQISSELAPGSVEVRLRGGEPDFAVEPAEQTQAPVPATAPAAAAAATEDDQDDQELARISLRIPAGVKRRADRAADTEGVSTNTWISRAIVAALDQPAGHASAPRRRSSGKRVTGWVQ